MSRRILFCLTIGLLSMTAASFAIPVDGHAYLENQAEHDSITVTFYVDSTGSQAASVLTDPEGYYQVELAGPGIYDIYFSHIGYVAHGIEDLAITEPITFDDVTLPVLPEGEYLSGQLDTTLATATYIIDGNLQVTAGDSLMIEPGTIFLINGFLNLEIYGYMSAVGTETDSIWFMNLSPTVRWGSIIFRAGADSQSVVSYCYVTGAGGSGLNTYSTNITISHCTFNDNAANWGGGIYVSFCNPHISDCIVTNNYSNHNGGGIYCTRSSPTITNCIVTGNICSRWWGSGRGGAGITANHLSSPIITDCVVSNNLSYRHGGGISVNDNSHTAISDCIITNNRADSTGGGIAIAGHCESTLSHCTIDSNSARYGGGLCFGWDILYSVDSCDIRANSADTLGGGIFVFDSSPSFSRCTVAYNTAPDTGGGIFAHHTNMDITNCTISHNGAPLGGNAYFTADSLDTLYADTLINTIFAFATDGEGIYLDTTTNNISITYCDVFGNAGGDFGGNIPEALGNIQTVNHNNDPCDYYYNIFLDPLFTNASIWDFQIEYGSPCIDAGDPAFPQDPDTTIADIGRYFYDQNQSILQESGTNIPTEFRLYQNYPNPFNAATVLKYSIPQAGKISLVIYNIMGQKVLTLYDGMQEPGTHRITWNASNVSSGVYFAQLHSANNVKTIKMVLLK
jgi:predicted outer membrane repeat protein/parallel beta-helix repeat protein